MTSISLLSKNWRQPQSAAGVKNMLAAGLASQRKADLITGENLTGDIITTVAGVGIYRPLGTVTITAGFPNRYTLIAVSGGDGEGENDNAFGRDDTGSDRYFQFRRGGNTRAVEFIVFNTVGSPYTATSDNYAAKGPWTLMGVVDGNSVKAYGGDVGGGGYGEGSATIVGTPKVIPVGGNVYVGSRSAAAYDRWDGTLLAYFILPYAVPNAMRRSILSNPWQLFEPRRIFVPMSSGATLPALSAATYMPGSLTSSGFRPRVTAS